MKRIKWLTVVTIIILAGTVFIMQPVLAAAFNPQPEPPGKQKTQGISQPGETKMGLEPSPFQPDSTKSKGISKPGETKSGIAIEDKIPGTAK
jgi:cytoskeletal protein RodZ